ncbi:MAG: PQQ-binding-like beta-propeller repeat protein, partial [Acidimicrobiaceae bacterium]|nr:PQQ-binding-like beta-propeller repeat protein [Acidimicrobiaceae bacterium]
MFALLPLIAVTRVHADDLTVSYDTLRDGWDQNEPGLTPSALQRGFGELFDAPLDGGQVYAQPVVVNGTVIVATERDDVYGFDAATGALKWRSQVTTASAPFYEPSSQIGCVNLTPDLGVTATPAVDPATNTVYISARSWDGQNGNSAQNSVHALDAGTGQERPGWPVTIQGSATNDAGSAYDPVAQRSRAGLLFSGGFVFIAYGSFCDFFAYKGWIASVPVSAPGSFKLYTDEPGSNGYEAGIWQAGGGIVSDGPGRLFVVTGNGFLPAGPLAGSPPPEDLGDSVVRLAAAPDGTLTPQDFFAPHDAQGLDVSDLDLGSGGAAAMPDSFGIPNHPHLMVVGGKEDVVYLLDRDNLGGFGSTLAQDGLARAGPFPGEMIFGHPAVWGGDGGFVYEVPGAGNDGGPPGPLRAFQIQVQAGVPSLVPVGASQEVFTYGAGSPLVTSDGTTNGSAVVWVTDIATNTLRAYGAVPQNGILQLLYSATVSVRSAEKFTVVAAAGNRIYVGTDDGHLLAFGASLQDQAAVTGGDQGLWVTQGVGSQQFDSLGGGLLGAPAVAAVPGSPSQAGTPVYIGVGGDRDLWVRTANLGWQRLTNAPVVCLDSPGAVIVGTVLHVACEGQDHALWYASGAMSGNSPPVIPQSAWQSLGGSFVSGPAMALVGSAGSPTIMGVGTDNAVWAHNVGDPPGTFVRQPWVCRGRPTLSRGNDAVFACHGPDDALWYSFHVGSAWTFAQSAGGALIGGVGLAAAGPVARAYVEGTDGRLWEASLLDPATSTPY